MVSMAFEYNDGYEVQLSEFEHNYVKNKSVQTAHLLLTVQNVR